MSTEKYLKRIERIDYLIRLKATGKPTELAKKLDISKTVLYETLAVMKEYGASIIYNRYIESFCYEDIGYFDFSFIQSEKKHEKTY